ncbi:hypothetical protein PVAP13_5NG157900 [Panicum virgatum]|uniref:Uncharacterized protein n=1 Tax=Panicum virgatum TaxID=38727 RepID=A0A8T0RVJ3_PANVG|nr:hypothetical protein PVAP13_5NG157900 [Panicum virgatum]
MPSSAAPRALLFLFLLVVPQIPSLLGSRSEQQHAAVADPAAGRRLLPVRAVPEQQPVEAVMKEKVAVHPLAAAPAMERTATRRSGSGWSAFADAVSKHQVPSGANPDSN